MCAANQRRSRCWRKTSARHDDTRPTPPLLSIPTRKARLFRVQILKKAPPPPASSPPPSPIHEPERNRQPEPTAPAPPPAPVTAVPPEPEGISPEPPPQPAP